MPVARNIFFWVYIFAIKRVVSGYPSSSHGGPGAALSHGLQVTYIARARVTLSQRAVAERHPFHFTALSLSLSKDPGAFVCRRTRITEDLFCEARRYTGKAVITRGEATVVLHKVGIWSALLCLLCVFKCLIPLAGWRGVPPSRTF